MTLQELQTHIESQAHVVGLAKLKETDRDNSRQFVRYRAEYIVEDEHGTHRIASFHVAELAGVAYYTNPQTVESVDPTYRASILTKLDLAVANTGNNYIGYTNLVFNSGSDGATVDVFVYDSGTDTVSRTAFYFDGAGDYKEMSA